MNSSTSFFIGFFLDYQNTLFPEQLFMNYSYGDPLYPLTHPFKILSNHSFPSLPTFNSTAIFNALLFWMNGWLCHNLSVVFLHDNMDLYSLVEPCILVAGRPCYVFYGTGCQVYWGMTHNVVFWWYSDLISYKHIHTKTHSTIRSQ